jgi:hypothetical protein
MRNAQGLWNDGLDSSTCKNNGQVRRYHLLCVRIQTNAGAEHLDIQPSARSLLQQLFRLISRRVSLHQVSPLSTPSPATQRCSTRPRSLWTLKFPSTLPTVSSRRFAITPQSLLVMAIRWVERHSTEGRLSDSFFRNNSRSGVLQRLVSRRIVDRASAGHIHETSAVLS